MLRALSLYPLLGISLVATATGQVGTTYCSPAVPNASGLPGRIEAVGATDLALHGPQLRLVASNVPTNTFGIFVTSRTSGFFPNPGGSPGNLCLGLPLGRYVEPGQILATGSAGSFELELDLARTPEGAGFTQVMPGDVWNFQGWFRDIATGGVPTSNFSDAVEVRFTDSGLPPGLVAVSAGTFLMGSDAPDTPPYYGSDDHRPVHQVTISYDFWMGAYEVTQEEYEALTGTNPSGAVGPLRPVERVSWHSAKSYCQMLTAQNAASIPPGYEFRLPTEAEWEYACRGGTTTEFNIGPELRCDQARIWYSDHPGVSCGLQSYSRTVNVGRHVPNALGLYDMHGNVWEWCLDAFSPYTAAPATDPFAATGSGRVSRGGGYGSESNDCRSASRRVWSPGQQSGALGFRVVLAPILVP